MNTTAARIRPDVLAMHAYPIANAEGLLKLDAMENPHRLPPDLQAELGRRLGAIALNRYPGGEVERLKAALRQHAEVPAGYDLVLGNGSDEIISLLAMAFDTPGASILAPLPGFVMYAISAQHQGLGFHGVPLDADTFALDAGAMCEAIATHRPALVYLAYPNNPTGTLWDDAAIEQVVACAGEHGATVVMDEAYQPFASRSYADRLTRHPHVLLMRTLSKFGLAGVRIGYLIGPEAVTQQVDKLRPPYNVSVLNAECALFALEHAAVFEAQAAQLRAEREVLAKQLAALPVATVWPSEANMILVRVPDAARTQSAMRTRGVLVKNVSAMHPLLANCLRITVSTPGENAQMLAALQASL
jgi:histidinol-phosphate aminotransferase